MRHVVVVLGLFLLLVGCKTDLEQVTHTDAEGYRQEGTQRVSDGAREGWWRKYAPDGQLLEAAEYENDTLHGMRVVFFEQGDTNLVEHYREGDFEGPYRLYSTEGYLQQSGQYRDNAASGVWKLYYPDGKVKEEVTFVNSLENGPFVEYYPNGQLKAKGSYLDGDYEYGPLEEYGEDGELVRMADCNNGRCKTTWRKGEGPPPTNAAR